MNEPTVKRSKYKEDFEAEALQKLYQLRPDLNGPSVWFFSTLKKSAEGCILYEESEKRAYVYDVIYANGHDCPMLPPPLVIPPPPTPTPTPLIGRGCRSIG
ncbi:9678_t:CDS:2 [Ambispora gerdemannii]|uniref:9678_t:CDS:1 n=1 Tax=Ambispora gerdemannii TaxID=144530 RepID=A0A9N9GD26_9GLOM|nr:9678_t:CDS:2 [Ambispora gerdemannii]